jgi:hypothetical protein
MGQAGQQQQLPQTTQIPLGHHCPFMLAAVQIPLFSSKEKYLNFSYSHEH